jgi:tryptophan 2,3-dioxygenase
METENSMSVQSMKAAKNYDQSVLAGDGENDYAKYMRTTALLSLQVAPEQMHHRDEMLFQIVHQSTELWLKLACNELEESAARLDRKCAADATALIERAAYCIALLIDQLEMLSYMTPWDFRQVRVALGNGSGFESPGWRRVQKVGDRLSAAFDRFIADEGIDLVTLYKEQRNSPAFNLAEALVDWDEKVALWRARHYKVAVRTIGHKTVGTKGTPVDALTRLLNHKFFPRLWDVRSTLFDPEHAY